MPTNPLRYTTVTTAPRLDPKRALFLATAGSPSQVSSRLAKLDAGLGKAIDVAAASAARVPSPPTPGAALKDAIAAGRRALLDARTTARRADLQATRDLVNDLQDLL